MKKNLKSVTAILCSLSIMIAGTTNIFADNSELLEDTEIIEQDIEREGLANTADIEMTAYSNEVITSGTCGDNLIWEINEDVLTIKGEGYMYDYTSNMYDNPSPWYASRTTIKRVVIDNGVQSVGNYAFCGCTFLNKVEIASGVKAIGNYAFNDCSQLCEITIPKSVTKMGFNVFSHCSRLATAGRVGSDCNIQFGWDTNIPSYAFYKAESLKKVEMPESIVSIGSYSFSYCTSLSEIDISKNIKTIKDCAFAGSGALDINVEKDNPNYSSVNGVLFNKNQTEILAYAKDINNPSYTIPNYVNKIGKYSFAYCGLLTEVIIPDKITSIEARAFQYCFSLKEITIPNSVMTMGAHIFKDSEIEDIYIDKVEGILDGSPWDANLAKITYRREISISPIPDYEYIGEENTPDIILIECKSDGMIIKQLVAGTDYIVVYSDNICAGTATATIEYINDYSRLPSKETHFTIIPKSCDRLTIMPITDQAYTGREIMPDLTIMNN